ncbi:A24 family peptidase [Corynebacterium sp. 209RC1]|uniref:prepilin peptidase n=1 Tax=unclassified Corynebacterium TaxID=2624378 RepID=UPI00211C8B57|nr:A24 family peptidase [Corynebacterium sp. 209RC1]MCQ9354601.1 A24 family peptidase [Corynebacterium sp. 1222RC1]MCQ9357999.1 A24 family peptidase [Corynebacterium sp. 142RC1]
MWFGVCLVLFWGWASALCWWDVREHRLPNVLTLPAAAAVLGLGLVVHPAALCGAALWSGLYASQRVLPGAKGAIGGGDVKLAVTLGAVLGFWGILPVLGAMAIAQVSTLLALVAARRQVVAHGPPMVLGTAVALAAAVNWGSAGSFVFL